MIPRFHPGVCGTAARVPNWPGSQKPTPPSSARARPGAASETPTVAALANRIRSLAIDALPFSAVRRPPVSLDESSIWRSIRVRRARRDRWIFLQALLEIRDNLHCGSRVPRVPEFGGRIFFLWIGDQIERLRLAEFDRRAPPIPLILI